MLKQRALTSLGAFAVVVVMTSGPDAARAIELARAPGALPAVSVPAPPTISQPSVLQVTSPKVTVALPPLPTVTPPKVAPPTVTAPQVAPPKTTVPTVAAPEVTPAVSVPSAPSTSLPGRGGASGGGNTSGSGAAPAGGGGAAAGGAPAAAGTDSARARARHAAPDPASKRQRRDRRLRQMVRNFSGCLGALPAAERRVLMLRAGTGPGRPLSRRQVAARIGSSPQRVARTERRGLRRLRAQARTSGCGAASPSDSSGDAPASTLRRETAPTVLAAFTSVGGSAGSVGRSNGSRSGVKGASATSPRAATAHSIVGDGGVRRPPLALLMLAAFLIGAGIAWKVLAPVRRSRSQA